jgi:hypothetical protein
MGLGCGWAKGDYMSASRKKSVTVLGAERQRLWDEHNSRTIDDEAVDGPIIKKIEALEAKILKSSFDNNRAARAGGLKILASGADASPREWCRFKIALFERLQLPQYA